MILPFLEVNHFTTKFPILTYIWSQCRILLISSFSGIFNKKPKPSPTSNLSLFRHPGIQSSFCLQYAIKSFAIIVSTD